MKQGFILTFLILSYQLLMAQQAKCDSHLQILRTTAKKQTFREALPLAEEMVASYPNCVSVRLELSEYYLLTELVDGDESGTNKAYEQLKLAILIDSTFESTARDFGIEVVELKQFKQKLNFAERTKQQAKIDSLNYWAILYDFSPNSEFKPK